MEFINDPIKSKKVFILMLCLTIAFFLTSGALGYLYYAKNRDYKNLNTAKQQLEEKNKSFEDLQKQIETITSDNKKLKTDITDQASAQEAKVKKAKAYNDVMRYFSSVVKAHNGFDDWTDAEYQTARAKAVITGDTAFVSTIDWAWNRHDIGDIDRAVGFWNAVADGIDNSLK
jgi:cell division protein FtsL